MNITTFNTPNSYMDKYHKPNFTANLKGSAINSAIKKAKDFVEVAEINEIIDNVSRLGDKTTDILCESSGMVTISNPKFGKVAHKFKMKLNENSDNPFIEMLARFDTDNFILKCETSLIDKRFAMTKTGSKKALYEMYKSSNLATLTENALDFTAGKHGIIKRENKNKNITLEMFKQMLFPEYFKK